LISLCADAKLRHVVLHQVFAKRLQSER